MIEDLKNKTTEELEQILSDNEEQKNEMILNYQIEILDKLGIENPSYGEISAITNIIEEIYDIGFKNGQEDY